MGTLAEPIGIFAELQNRRAVAVSRISAGARHAAFPEVYEAPKPLPDAEYDTRQEVEALSRKNEALQVEIGRLHAKIMEMEERQSSAQDVPRRTLLSTVPVEEVERIVAVVARLWDVPVGAITSSGRLRDYVRPRQACYRLVTDLLGMSRPATGRCFGRDHTTILAGLRSAAILHETNADWAARYDSALQELTGKGA